MVSNFIAGFASLVCLPTVIVSPGWYKTRSGEVVWVGVVSSKQDFGCAGKYQGGVAEHWHKSGRILFNRETPNDIVKKLTVP